MSSLYVRNLARRWINDFATISYVDTINRQQNPKLPLWITIEFFASSNEGLMGCEGYIEYGTIDLIFMSTAGLGDTNILTEIESTIPLFMSAKDPDGKLSLLSYEPPRELSDGDADLWYRIGAGVEYMYTF